MKIDLEQKSKELKGFVSQFDSNIFLGDIKALMDFIPQSPSIEALKDLKSPLRQLYYLAGLNLSSAMPENGQLVPQYTDDDWKKMVGLLNEIEEGYDQLLIPELDGDVNEDWIKARQVAVPTFLSFFNQGALNYQEQIIERIEKEFIPYDNEIEAHFNLTVEEFLQFYYWIDEHIHDKLNSTFFRKKGEQSLEEFGQEMLEKGIMHSDWKNHLPNHLQNLFESMYDKGKVRRINKNDFTQKFTSSKVNSFLNLLSAERSESDFLYFSQKNPLHQNPIYKVNSNEYQFIETKQVLYSIYELLNTYCKNNEIIKDKYLKNQKKLVELKVLEIIKRILKGKPIVFHNYFVDGNEQDILILHKSIALIIEVKAYKKREPLRDPERAFPRIENDFKKEIGYGYEQAFRIKEKFLDNEEFEIKDESGKLKDIIRGKKYHQTYCIIVTLERYGQIQIDLSNLLEIYEDDEFPYSICIDDLEVFILSLVKKSKGFSEFIQFLYMRQFLHGHVYSNDELQICGGYLKKLITLKTCRGKENVVTYPELNIIFDELYKKGIGFSNEINLDKKRSGKYIVIG